MPARTLTGWPRRSRRPPAEEAKGVRKVWVLMLYLDTCMAGAALLQCRPGFDSQIYLALLRPCQSSRTHRRHRTRWIKRPEPKRPMNTSKSGHVFPLPAGEGKGEGERLEPSGRENAARHLKLSPSPQPSPLVGEGATDYSREQTRPTDTSQAGRRYSLSPGERARVRASVRQTPLSPNWSDEDGFSGSPSS